MIYHHIHNSLPLDPILNQINLVHIHSSYIRSIWISPFNTCLRLLTDLLIPDFQTKILYALLISTVYATWPVNFILLDVIILITPSGEEYKLWNDSLCSFSSHSLKPS
jgi:hypothetical protein